MPEHVHLLVSETEFEVLATAIQALKIAVARREIHYREEGQGTTFRQKRYYDHNVRHYESFIEKLRYIHRNPVKRGLVSRGLEVEQLSALHRERTRTSGDRVAMDRRSPDRKISQTVAASAGVNSSQRPHIC